MIHPNIWWDKIAAEADTIVLPDPYTTEGYLKNVGDVACMGVSDVPWDQKFDKAYWQGAWTGREFLPDDGGPISKEKEFILNQKSDTAWEVPDGSGHPADRYKLMFKAHERPDLI